MLLNGVQDSISTASIGHRLFKCLFSTGYKTKRCGCFEGKTKFLQVSNWTYLKRPPLGATVACVSDLLHRQDGAALRGRHTGFHFTEWESRITFAVTNKRIPICISLLKMLLCFCGFFL